MFKVMYLPTAEYVYVSPKLNTVNSKEKLIEIIKLYDAYKPGDNLFFLSRPPANRVSKHKIPKYLLEVVEVPDV